MTHVYYAIAKIPGKKRLYGIHKAAKIPGQMTTQEWTGEQFKRFDDALARMDQLNSTLARRADGSWTP